MIVDLTKILKLQKNLDDYIHEKFNLTYEKTKIQRRLALLVEIGEFVNEIRCFKFWSQKDKSSDSIILDEFADILHFAFSSLIGFPEFEFSKKFVLNIKISKSKFSKIELCKKVVKLYNYALSYKTFNELLKFVKYSIGIIFYMGYSWKKVLSTYLLKNTINHERQKNAY